MQPIADGAFDLEAQRRGWAAGAPAPMVSCLMVTKDRAAMAARAIACFRTQTYPNVELVVVDDSSGDTLEHHVRTLEDRRIRFHRLPPDGQPLGELRNIAVDRAGGTYVSQWDDDDLYDPARLEVQMAAILALGAEACFLTRERLWWPARCRIAISRARLWEGSMVCAREKLPRYPSLGLRARFRHVTLVKKDFGPVPAGPRWTTGIQRRRSVLARARNHLISRALAEEEWVLWLDVDVAAWPPGLVQRLLGAGKDIVVPHCVTEPAGPTYDLNTFTLRPGSGALNWPQRMRDGILQPPRGFGRIYPEDLREKNLVRVDSVGGTALLVRADLHRDGLIFPSIPYRHLIETEGMAALARDMGTACWALPALEVVHPHRASDVPGTPVPASRSQSADLHESRSEKATPHR